MTSETDREVVRAARRLHQINAEALGLWPGGRGVPDIDIEH